jgi:AcrR family transcriptional regulator
MGLNTRLSAVSTQAQEAKNSPTSAAARIEAAALELFSVRGYRGTTTRDIAAHLGMSPAAVYVHFSSKEELLLRIVRVGHEQALSLFEEGLASGTTPIARIERAVHRFAAWHALEQPLARVAQYELDALSPESRRAIGKLRTTFERSLCREIEMGIVQGAFRVENVPATATAIFSVCVDIARWFSPGRRDIDELGRFYAQLSLRMLGVASDGA